MSEHISAANSIIESHEVLIKLIILTKVLIHLMTYPLMIYNIKSHLWRTKCIYNWTKVYAFHIYGGHFEYFKLFKGGNMPPTWNCSLGPYRWIIKREKTVSFNLTPTPTAAVLLGQIMTRYKFMWAKWVILSNVRTDFNLIYFRFWSILYLNWGE